MEELVDKLNLECKHRNSKGVLIPRKWTVDDVNLNDANYLEYAYCTLIDKGYYDDLLCDACRATLTEVFETKHSVANQLKEIREELRKLQEDMAEIKTLLKD